MGIGLLTTVTGGCGHDEPSAPGIPDIGPTVGFTDDARPSSTDLSHDSVLAFTHTVLVSGATVLGSYERDEPGNLHAVVVEVDPSSVDRMLADSGFTRPLVVGRRVRAAPVPGYPPGTGDRIASAQDHLTQSLVREVLVDRTDPDRVRVHVWAYFVD